MRKENREAVNDRFLQELDKHKIIAILRGVESKYLLATVEALCEGGLRMVEVALPDAEYHPERYEDTLKGIRALKEGFGEQVYLGAGPVVTTRQAQEAAQSGAGYLIAPNFDPEVVACAIDLGCVPLPGVFTPSEIVAAVKAGAPAVKLFPAGNMGPDYLKAIRAPLPDLKIIAVGGIKPENMDSYMKAGAAGIGMGGALCDRGAIRAGDWGKLRRSAQELVRILKENN